MSSKEIYEKLLEDIVSGFLAIGYKERGGSCVIRFLTDKDGNELRVFLNDYINPSYIITRYGYHKDEENLTPGK